MPKNKKIVTYIKKYDLYIFLILLVLSVILKVAFFSKYAFYNHDTVRDLTVSYKLYAYKEWPLRGPVVSDIWVHLSPIYFYILFPIHYFFKFNPASSPGATVAISVFTGIAIFITLKKHLGKIEALVAFFIYSFSFGVVKQSGYGLNPNYVTLFSVFLIYGILSTLKGKSSYLILVAASLGFMVSFHTSSFFIIPGLVFIYFWYRPALKRKDILLAILILVIIAGIPYGISEKKFEFFNTKMVYKYIFESGGTTDSVPFLQSQVNYYAAAVKNISRTLFFSFNKVSLSISLLFLASCFYYTYSFFKASRKKVYEIGLFALLLVFYLVFFSFFIRLKAGRLREWFFHPVFIPIFVMYLSTFLVKVTKNKFWILLIILATFLFIHINAFFVYIPTQSNYGESRKLATFVLNNSGGQKFKILNSNRSSFNYLLWYFEDRKELKSWHYEFVKYGDRKRSNDVPICYYFLEKKEDYTKDKIYNSLNSIFETPSTLVYKLDSCNNY